MSENTVAAPNVREHIITFVEEDGLEPGEAIFDANILAVDFDPVTNVGDVVSIRGEDETVTMRIGSMLNETFSPEVALKIGEAFIRAALSQMPQARHAQRT